jgi:hypothetical protein
MKKFLPLLLMIAPLAGFSADQNPGPYKFFTQFIGGTWVSQDFEYKPGHTGHQESTYTWGVGNKGIKGELFLYEGNILITHEEDLIVWNPVSKQFLILGTDSLGNVKQGNSHVEDGVLVSEVNMSLADGRHGTIRGRLTIDGDTIDGKIYKEGHGSDWVQALELKLKRRP